MDGVVMVTQRRGAARSGQAAGVSLEIECG